MKRILYLLLLVPAPLFADDVYLEGGAKFSGRIVNQTATMVTVDTGDGVIGLAMTRVTKIVKGRSPLDEYDDRAAALKPDDVDGWRTLGQWASQQGLSKQSTLAYQKVIDVAPDDSVARQALGFVLIQGHWMTEEQSYLARGYVKHDGEWMSPKEAQAAETADAAEQSREAAEQSREAAEQRADQAAADKATAEAQAKKAEAESQQMYRPPVYYGGWGYGVRRWPSTANVGYRSGYQLAPTGSVHERLR